MLLTIGLAIFCFISGAVIMHIEGKIKIEELKDAQKVADDKTFDFAYNRGWKHASESPQNLSESYAKVFMSIPECE